MKQTVIHAMGGSIAMLSIATFWTSTLVAELLLGHAAVLQVKHAIAWVGIPVLTVAMLVTGATGKRLGRGRQGRLLAQKMRRMPLLAGNGVLVMLPAAYFLYYKAAAGQFDLAFLLVQGLELSVGLVQLTLMGRNFVAGLRLSGRLRDAATGGAQAACAHRSPAQEPDA